jgi:hypothetical protein
MARNPEIAALEGELNSRYSRRMGLDANIIATDPPVSEAQRKAMFAAASGHSTLGIPKKVGEEFVGKPSKDGNVPTGSQPGSDAAPSPSDYHAQQQAHHADYMKKHQGASVTASMHDDVGGAAQIHSKAANSHQAAMLAHGTAKQRADQMSPGYPQAKAEAGAAGMRADAMTKAMMDQRQGNDQWMDNQGNG